MCHHYDTAPEQGPVNRGFELCKQWQVLGHKPHIISADFHHQYHVPPIQHKTIHSFQSDFIPFHILPTPVYQKNNWRRVLNMAMYGVNLWRYRKQLIAKSGKPQVIIAAIGHPFHVIPAWLIAKQCRAKFILEVRDVWRLSLIEFLQLSPMNPFVKLISALEKFGFRKAHHVVSLFPNTREYLQSQGMKPITSITHIPNGVTTKQTTSVQCTLPTPIKQTIQISHTNGSFLLGFAGAHGKPNALEQLLEAMAILSNQIGMPPSHSAPNITLFLLGSGTEKNHLKAYAEKHKLQSVYYFDPVNKEQAQAFMKEMDALFIGSKKATLYQQGFSPKKLFEYMAAEKPILCAVDAYENPAELAGGALIVPPEDPEQLSKAIMTLVNLPVKTRIEMGKKNLNYVMKHHNMDQLGRAYSEIFT